MNYENSNSETSNSSFIIIITWVIVGIIISSAYKFNIKMK